MDIIAHNATESSYKLGNNKISDWTEAQNQSLLTYRPLPNAYKIVVVLDTIAVPNYIYWIAAGAVNPIKDQS